MKKINKTKVSKVFNTILFITTLVLIYFTSVRTAELIAMLTVGQLSIIIAIVLVAVATQIKKEVK